MILLAAEGDADGWTLTLRGTDRDAISDFDRTMRAAGYAPELRDLHAGTLTGHTTLTDRQREALELAVEGGYYERPRETTTEAIGEAMGIDRRTVEEHLRKVERRLVTTLVEDGGAP